MENYEIQKAVEDYTKRIEDLYQVIDPEELRKSIISYEEEMLSPTFWDNQAHSKKVLKAVKVAKDKLVSLSDLKTSLEELELYFSMHKQEDEVMREIEQLILEIETALEEFEIEILLSGEHDDNDALLEIHPGAGGTESQDWAMMVYRMYKKYCEKKGYDLEVLDYQDGEEAGIKSVSFVVHGQKAYGYLKAEHGVHRLVRISPFDSNARRHTSFCSVQVTPTTDEEIDIQIRPEDIKIDTYRSSGAGGQSVNTTDSAVRITHLPTKTVVTCQNERSQIQNRERAMQILKSKLYQAELEAQEAKIKQISKDSKENSFGSQIRSYVFHPYAMVKDHRTNFETSQTQSVMDGDIEGFINAYLKEQFS